jgi:hypothetical protein
MGSPSEAEVRTQLQNATKLLEEQYQWASENGDNLVGLVDTLEQALEGDEVAGAATAAQAIRNASAIALTSAPALLLPILRHYGKVIDVPDRDPDGLLDRLYKHFHTNTITIQSRQITYDTTPTLGGSNVGDGTIHRLTVDENAYNLEACHVETKTARCEVDQNTGADVGEEIFELYGGYPGADANEVQGSGLSAALPCYSARHSLLRNASFSDLTDGGVGTALTALDNWTAASDIGNLSSSATVYRTAVGDATPRSISFDANETITQKLSTNRQKLEADTPYYLQVALSRDSSGADGDLEIRLGTTTKSVDLTTLHASNWTVHRLDLDENLWYQQFAEDDLAVDIQLSGGATFGCLVDEALLVPFVPFDGTWWAAIGGETAFLEGDTLAWTDTEVGSVIQWWLWLAFGWYLPSAASTPTIADT